MDRIAQLDLANLGTTAAAALCQSDTSYRAFQKAGQVVLQAIQPVIEQVRIYVLDADDRILREEALVDRDGGMEGSDHIPLYQLPVELTDLHQPYQHSLGRQHEALFPLCIDTRLVGMLALVSKHEYPTAILERLYELSHGLALGVLYAQRSREGNRASFLLKAVTHMSREMQALAGTRVLLESFVALAVDALGFDRATFVTLGGDQETVREALCARAGFGVFELPVPPALPTLKDEPFFLPHLPGIWIPVRMNGILLGAFFVDNIYSLEPPPPDAVQALVDLSGQAALALENARLIDRLRDMALKDDLTGLYRPTYFSERVKEELSTAARRGDQVGLLMMDLDRFKRINDTWGHPVGDQVLARVAERIRGNLRVGDIACRKGGDEFIALIPGLTTEQASGLAQRLLSDVWEHPVELANGVKVHISLSMGLALFPTHAPSWQELWERADEALYRSKEAGRGRSTLWGHSA